MYIFCSNNDINIAIKKISSDPLVLYDTLLHIENLMYDHCTQLIQNYYKSVKIEGINKDQLSNYTKILTNQIQSFINDILDTLNTALNNYKNQPKLYELLSHIMRNYNNKFLSYFSVRKQAINNIIDNLPAEINPLQAINILTIPILKSVFITDYDMKFLELKNLLLSK